MLTAASGIDLFVVFNAFGGFLLFFLIYNVFFRFVSQSKIFRYVEILFFSIAAANLALGLSPQGYSWAGLILSAILSLFLYALMVFLFTMCVCAMHESSIRIRLLREIAKVAPRGLSLDEILQVYDAPLIIQRRLSRFLASGELSRCDEVYRPGRTFSCFLFYLRIVKLFRAVYGRPRGYTQDLSRPDTRLRAPRLRQIP